MTETNTVEVSCEDRACHLYGLTVNGRSVSVARVCDRYDKNNRPIYEYFADVANEFNPSSRLRFRARTLNVLVRKLKSHPQRLVKY